MNSNRNYLYTLVLILSAFLPALVFRDLNNVNELNYFSIAQEALNRESFFAFYYNGLPYADKPPLYLWLCMIGLKFFGSYASIFVLFFSLLPFIGSIVLLDRAFGREFSHFERLLVMIGMGSLLSLDIIALVARMDMLFAFVILAAWLKMVKRYSLLKEHQVCKYGNLKIPLLIFLALFIKGPYAIIFPLVALAFMLAYNKDLKMFFKVFRPYYFIIILFCVGIWGGLVFLDGGEQYALNLFFKQSQERLSGAMGHPEPFYYYLKVVPMMALPICLSALYFIGRQLKQPYKMSLPIQANLFYTLAVIVVISIPSSKLEIYAVPAIPTLFYFVMLSYKQMLIDNHSLSEFKLILVKSNAQDNQKRNTSEDPQDDLEENLVKAEDAKDQGHLSPVNQTVVVSYRNQVPGQNNAPINKLFTDSTSLTKALVVNKGRKRLPLLLSLSFGLPLVFYISLIVAYFIFYDNYLVLQNSLVGLAFSLLSFFSLVAFVLLCIRMFLSAVALTGIGTLVFVFVVGLSMGHLNKFLSVEEMVREVSMAIDIGGSKELCTFNLKNAHSLTLIDPRLKLTLNTKSFEQCLNDKSSIIYTRADIRYNKDNAQQLLDMGGYYVGEQIVLPSAQQNPKSVKDISLQNNSLINETQDQTQLRLEHIQPNFLK